MTVWYRTEKHRSTITPVDVVKVSEQFITVTTERWGDRRTAKNSSYERYFPSEQEARTYLIQRYTEKVKLLRKDLESAESELTALLEEQ